MTQRTEGNSESEIRVAKIGALQAITVALITAVAGLAAGYYARPQQSTSDSTPKQRWLEIEGVDSNGFRRARVVAVVDSGVSFSYPTDAVWAELGQDMPSQRFPLPSTSSAYNVQFRAFLTNTLSDTAVLAECTFVEELKVTELPTRATYDLFPVVNGQRGANSVATVRFAVR